LRDDIATTALLTFKAARAWAPWNAMRWPAMDRAQLRFALGFAGTSALLFGAYAFPYAELGWSEAWFDAYLSAYAHLVGHLLRSVDPGVSVDGTLITGRYALRIVKTCDAMETNLLFTAAVLAVAGPWRRKLGALALGLGALLLLNVLRISTLYFAGVFTPGAFRVLHEEIWPPVLVALAGGAFVLSLTWIRRGLPEREVAAGR
jgi:exosortase/archaeosortase family protein